jgi:intraflagellar transport protein 140
VQALGALNEALKCMSKAKMRDFNEQEAKVSSLQQRIILVKK